MSLATLTQPSPDLRSSVSDRKVPCLFLNQSPRTVSPVWFDFAGRSVRYPDIKPGHRLTVDSFESHPWCFFDSENFTVRLSTNKGEIFWPAIPPLPQRRPGATDRIRIAIVRIHIPLYSLFELSVQALTRHHIPTCVLPRSLQSFLEKRENSKQQLHFVIHSPSDEPDR
jgi:hypothetical protein